MEEVSLREYIEVMLRWKWLIIGLTLIAMVAAAVVSFLLITPTYEARGSFGVQVLKVNLPSPVGGVMPPELAGPSADDAVTAAQGEEFLQKVVARLGDGAPQGGVAALRGRLRVESSNDKSKYTLVVSGPDPAEAQRVANAALGELTEYTAKMGREELDRGLALLETQRQQADQELRAAQEELLRFVRQGSNPEVLLAEREALGAALEKGKVRQVRLGGELAAARAELAETKRLLAVTDPKVRLKRAVPLQGGLVEEEEINPAYTALAQRVNELNGRVAALKAEDEGLAQALKKDASALQQLVMQQTEQEQECQRLADRGGRQKSIYDNLANQINQLRVAQALGGNGVAVTVLSKAALPSQPVSPRGALNVAVAAVLGLMASVFLAFFIEYWRTSGSQGMAPGTRG